MPGSSHRYTLWSVWSTKAYVPGGQPGKRQSAPPPYSWTRLRTLTPDGEWSTGPAGPVRTTTTRPASAGRDSSQKSDDPSEHSSESETLPVATRAAVSREAQCPYDAMVATVRTYPVPPPSPEPDRGRPDSADRIRFPAYVLSKAGAVTRPAVVQLGHQDLPAGEVLVRVEWSAVNYKDALVTRPGNRLAAGYPLVPGVELTGIVEQSSDEIVAPGARVLVQGYDLGVTRHGGFAGFARVPADWVVTLPSALSCRDAAVIGVAGFAALLSKRRLLQYGISPGDGPVLVTGASGGVGSATVAVLAHAGFEVVASTGKTTERAYLEGLGASRVVGRSYADDDGRALGPQLWAAAVDCVGGVALAEALRTVRYGGAVAAGGLAGGNVLTTTVYPFIVRGVALLGIDTEYTPIEERRATWAEMPDSFPMERCGEMVDEEIGLGGLTAALDRVLDAAVRGRILVRPDRLSAPGGNGIQPA